MAVAYRSIATKAYSAGAATCNKPAGTASGDELIGVVYSDGTPSISGPSGWSRQMTDTVGSGGDTWTFEVWTKQAGGSEPASYTWTGTNGNTIHIVAASGPDATNPINVVGAVANSTGDTATANSVTTTVDNCLLIGFFNNFWGAAWNTAPSGMTERGDTDGLGTFTQDLGAAGATGTRAAVAGSTFGATNASILIAIAPAASGAITGDAAITEAADTLSSAGVLALAGAAAITEASDTLASAAVLALTGAAAIAEVDDTLAAAATLPIAGVAGITEADDSLSSAGALALSGAAALTEADDSLSAAGGSAVFGEAALTEADDTLAAAGTLPIAGALAQTEADDTLSGAGVLAIVGMLTVTEDGDTLLAVSTIAIVGQAAMSEADDTLSAAETAAQPDLPYLPNPYTYDRAGATGSISGATIIAGPQQSPMGSATGATLPPGPIQDSPTGTGGSPQPADVIYD